MSQRIAARVRLGTANERELKELAVWLDYMRECERAGRPVLPPRTPDYTKERFNTRHLIAQIRRANRKSRYVPLMGLVAVLVTMAAPLLFLAVRA